MNTKLKNKAIKTSKTAHNGSKALTNGNLALTASKEGREQLKDKAVTLREQGNLQEALNLFDQVITWDEKNDNLRGKVDVLGHKKITLTLLSDNTKKASEKKEYLAKALECVREAISIVASNDFPAGFNATQQVHMASLLYRLSALLEAKEKAKKMREAIEYLDTALVNLPGSKAHRAWPLSIKATILHDLGQDDRALETLYQATSDLYFGYDGEIKGADQGELKLRVWNSGLALAFAKIFADSGKPILAEVHASAVLNTPDPDGVLVARKKEAEELLERISK